MNLRQAILLTTMLGVLPALSGCVAAVVPVVAASLAAKKKLIDKKQRVEVVDTVPAPAPEPTPAAPTFAKAPEPALVPTPVIAPAAAPERVPVFAGEGSTRASLAPAGLGNPPAPKLYTVEEAPPPPAPVVTTTVIYPAPAPQSKAPAPAVVAPREQPKTLAKAQSSAALPDAAEKGTNGYAALAAYAIRRSNSPEANSSLDVIDPANPLAKPRRAQCGGLAPAVMIDLDPGLSTFDPDALKPAAGLGDALAALRAAGITILWTSALPVEQSEIVHFTLARSGLDANRTDRLLLLKGGGDRKQARRNLAARNWCVIAMAGDRRGDFDEAFDYLRDPDSKIPADALFGDGWFIVPPPMP